MKNIGKIFVAILVSNFLGFLPYNSLPYPYKLFFPHYFFGTLIFVILIIILKIEFTKKSILNIFIIFSIFFSIFSVFIGVKNDIFCSKDSKINDFLCMNKIYVKYIFKKEIKI